MIIELSKDKTIDEIVTKNNKVIIDIYATWCGPCKMLTTQLEAFEKIHNDWTILRIDSDQHQDITNQFNVQAFPTILIFIGGKKKERLIGYQPLIELEKITSKY